MRNIPKKIFVLLLMIAFALPASAQFRSLLKRANKDYELHAFNLAIRSYKNALKRRPDNEEALGKLADCYRHLNEMNEAAKWYAQAVKQRKVDAIHILNYGKVLKALGRYAEAKQLFQRYAQFDPVVGNHFAASCNFAISQLSAPSPYIVQNERINSSSAEFGPAFYGDRLVYASARSDIRQSSTPGRDDTDRSGRSFNQLFIATISPQTGELTSPVFFKQSREPSYKEGPLVFSSDLETVIFTKNNFLDGTRHLGSSGMELNLFEARTTPYGGWQNEVPFPYNGNNYSTGFPHLSPDGEQLYFASNRPDGFGGYDIYVSFRTRDGWSTPENLGPVINSPGDEISPFFDGQNLYFSSDWHQGMGGYDVFRATQNNNRWSRIFHLGSRINSPRDDYGFIYDSFRNIGYMTSNRSDGRGNGDIYRFAKTGDGIVVRVKNASDGSPISNAEIDFSECGRGVQLTDANGIYSFQAQEGIDCSVVIRKDSFISSNLNLTAFGLTNNRSFEVTLSKVGEEYIGKIVSYATRLPVKGISIMATNQNTGSFTETKSNQTGEYSLALSPGAVYLLRYSAPGFRDVNRTVRTTEGIDLSILGTISMLPSTSAGGGAIISDEGSSTPSDIEAGFAVQLAALGSPDLGKFNNLSDLGQLYYKSEGNLYKIRIGVFGSRQAAEDALATVKNRGVSGAFITEERGGPVSSINQPEDETEDTSGVISRYKIQLGVFRNPAGFDASKIEYLGMIEDRKRNNLTIKLLSGFDTEASAKQALAQVKKLGFRDAFVVMDQDGQLVRVK